MRGDDRAVSSALSYALIVVIIVSLTGGLVVGADALVVEQREQVAQDQLGVVAERLAASITTVDRMAAVESSSPVDRAAVRRDFPRRIAGSQYRVTVTHQTALGNVVTLTVETRDLDVEVTVRAQVEAALRVRETTVNGGPLLVRYDAATSEVVIANA